ncbi:MAG: hypothetical protein FRX49_05769 [Trebouxia sp. A1-2]|nr:MAG: hypothetical protein FRX49_05769 [Trebouxia sp. A1-2]
MRLRARGLASSLPVRLMWAGRRPQFSGMTIRQRTASLSTAHTSSSFFQLKGATYTTSTRGSARSHSRAIWLFSRMWGLERPCLCPSVSPREGSLDAASSVLGICSKRWSSRQGPICSAAAAASMSRSKPVRAMEADGFVTPYTAAISWRAWAVCGFFTAFSSKACLTESAELRKAR